MKIRAPYQLIFIVLSFTVACASNAKQIERQESEMSLKQAQASPASASPGAAGWRGANNNFSVSWTGDNISVQNIQTEQEVFSARKFAAYRLTTEYKSMFTKKGEPDFLDFYFRYKILALAGSIMFLKETTSYSPASYKRETYLAIDLKTPRKRLSLKEFYSPDEILAALLGNEEIKQEFQKREKPLTEKPKTLDEFLTFFHSGTNGDFPTQSSDSINDKCWFPPDIFDSFAITQIENNKVVAEIGIPCRGEGMREDSARPLKLTLPLSNAFKAAFSGEFSIIRPGSQNQEALIAFFVPSGNRQPEDKGSLKIRSINDLNQLYE